MKAIIAELLPSIFADGCPSLPTILHAATKFNCCSLCSLSFVTVVEKGPFTDTPFHTIYLPRLIESFTFLWSHAWRLMIDKCAELWRDKTVGRRVFAISIYRLPSNYF